ncbi:MAG: hypothetical protein COA94_08260 [Rickettsiales bacterium]|nr:MAG: hypothetical protein COA94_08260 [Rickettsiales bacterium]
MERLSNHLLQEKEMITLLSKEPKEMLDYLEKIDKKKLNVVIKCFKDLERLLDLKHWEDVKYHQLTKNREKKKKEAKEK